MRAGVYIDQAFWRDGDDVYSARSFVIFLGRLAERFDRLTVAARLSPDPDISHYRLPEPARFAPLPYYESAARPLDVASATRESIRRFGALLDDVDVVWLLGPQPLALLFAAMAARRRKKVVLGVRQDLPEYVRNRRPGRRDLHAVAWGLDLAFRRLARRFPVVVVGPDLARNYAGACSLLDIYVSLVEDDQVLAVEHGLERSYDGEVRILSVGRIDAEKNPLLLIDVLERLDDRFKLVVCGDGPLEYELESLARERGLGERVELRGHVAMGPELIRLYRESDMLLHVSWTEGVPQVLLEAFAAALPTVATAVGGVAEAAGEGAILIPPGDPGAASAAIERLAADAALRARILTRANHVVVEHTLEAEARRVAEFLRSV
jgi:glycosyltransferase involved in cell wall biosynthesis